MSEDEDRKPSAVNHLDNHNNNNNSNNNNEDLNLDDFVETEDYEPMDPDGFVNDLLSTTATAVGTIMSCWGTHMYHWYCYKCNQQLLSTGQGDG
jgi:hypothetical protein